MSECNEPGAIKITEAMIEAGLKQFRPFDHRFYDAGCLMEDIFVAMLAASKDERAKDLTPNELLTFLL